MQFKNMKIATKLGLGFGLVITLMLVLGAVTLTKSLSILQAIELSNDDRLPKTMLAHQIKDELNETARNMRDILLLKDAAELEGEYKNIAESTGIIDRGIDKLHETVHSPQGKPLIDQVIEERAAFKKAQQAFLGLARAGEMDAARALLLKEARPLLQKYFDTLDKFSVVEAGHMEQAGREAKSAAHQMQWAVVVVLVMALALSVLVVTLVIRAIVPPLQAAVKLAQRVADGDLETQIEVHSKDEMGELMHALRSMTAGLREIVLEVRHGTETMATASSEIASGNMDLSTRTEQQAGAIEETASSMEAMKTIVRQNAEHTRQATQMAASASELAQSGGRVVQDVVQTMNGIHASSRKIVDIIAVIDSIAFQTNILALNAAVEAARAGEQGRGFAVVAGEVRGLAQRSAEAAREIKHLINDSVSQVENGAGLVTQAGDTMQQLLDSVNRVAGVMNEIATASTEQNEGISQVHDAIAQMDTMTQQNAALVEEAAATSAAMQEQAERLAELVRRFRTGDVALAPANPVALQAARPSTRPALPSPKRTPQLRVVRGRLAAAG